MNGAKERLIRLVQISAPVKNKMLADMLGMSERNVRILVQELRHANYPIGFNGKGFFLANNMDELRHTINVFITKGRTNVETRYDLEHVEFDIAKLRARDRSDNEKVY